MLPMLLMATMLAHHNVGNHSQHTGHINHTGHHHMNHTGHHMSNHTSHHIVNHTGHPATHNDIISIVIKNNWTDVCHHAKFYLSEFCSFLMLDPLEQVCEATPLKVGDLLCFRGICICLMPSRREMAEETRLTARLHHTMQISNNTALPDWITSIYVEPADDRHFIPILVASGMALLAALLTIYCILKVFCKYVGYKKLKS